ncbi:MAG TPA: HAD family phosphatase [Thermotogota bacterium]|nr:HAD family phosphatase [Thermotogota bacterium]HNT95996.1 HAD family phosphatase [Thermotogota bacterium]
MKGYKNIVFDIGNVLVRYDPVGFLERSPFTEQKSELIRHIFDAELWIELDRGTIEEETVFQHLSEKYPELREGIAYISKHWIDEVFSVIEGTSRILTGLKDSGYRIYLLSNFGERGFLKISKEYSFFGKIDGKIVSYEVKTVKPEKKIYDLLLERYGLDPKETIYIDDRPENLVIAEKYGILCHHFQNPETLAGFLKRAGVHSFGGEKGSTGTEE